YHSSFLLRSSHAAPRVLPSFPTRRSSDLRRGAVHGRRSKGFAPGDELRRRPPHLAPLRPGRADQPRRGARQRSRVDLHDQAVARSEEHTSELQSLAYLVCRLLLEKKKKDK